MEEHTAGLYIHSHEVHIPRYISTDFNVVNIQLHGFGDASSEAYGSIIYIRVVQPSGDVQIHIIFAKSKVAPIRPISIPRLELCAAVLTAKLLQLASETLPITINETYAWSDSKVVLTWISQHLRRWTAFVSNRVSTIQEIVPSACWNYVKSKDNPADILSRGCSITELQNNTQWWNGPDWLSGNISTSSTVFNDKQAFIEESNVPSKLIAIVIKPDLSLLEKYSSLRRVTRVTSFILRMKNKNKGVLTSNELQYALKRWIRKIQSIHFHDDLQQLNKKGVVKETSSIKKLYPFIDEEGILRVGGRIQNSQSLSYDQKHQILLLSSSHLTDIIILHEHNLNLHPGTELLLSILRNKYWIINGKHTVKRLTRKCIICFKQYASTMKQLMGNFPAVRITPSRPFTNTGVDYAGPFLIRPHLARSRTTTKAYIALFICLCTKAVHLELITSLSTEAFIATFRRFISRRGLPLNMYSDNGTNFVGANTKLKDLYNQLQSQQFQNEIHDKFSMENITWHFIPPAAPHMGGLWESFIKLTKKTFERVIGERTLNFEEFYTILTQIEACINSRPLYALSSDPTDYNPLTPGHFLIGSSLLSLPESVEVNQVNYKTRWELQNKIVHSFWTRWSSSYITYLQTRSKWTIPLPDVQVEDLVLIHQSKSSPLHWKLGRVLEVHPGQDNKVRVVTIKTSSGIIKRPITKLTLLPLT